MQSEHVDGIVLDKDFERTNHWELPLVTKTNILEIDDVEISSWQDTYGEAMFIGDVHVGHEQFSTSVWNAHLSFLKQRPHIQIGLMGDYIENAATTRYVNDEVLPIHDQIDLFIKYMQPFKDRIMFILWGNHEERDARDSKKNILIPFIANQIGLDESSYVAKPQRGVNMILTVGKIKYGLYAYHGSSNAIVNKFNQLEKTSRFTNASVLVQGHNHHLGMKNHNFRETSADRMGTRITKNKMLVCSGCFMKDASYAESKSYPLNIIGAPIIRFFSEYGRTQYTDLSTTYRHYLLRGGITPDLGEGMKSSEYNRLMGDVSKLSQPTGVLSPEKSKVSLKKHGNVLL